MCVYWRTEDIPEKSKLLHKFEGEVFWKRFAVPVDNLAGESVSYGLLLSPHMHMPMKRGKVYVSGDGNISIQIPHAFLDISYPLSYHVHRHKPFLCPYLLLPCVVSDVVAFDESEIAARVLFIFTEEDYKRYLSDLSTLPLDIEENEIKVKTESEGVLN